MHRSIWTPRFWSGRGVVTFNFTGFMDYQSGVARYEWGIGSRPYAADVLPLAPLDAPRVLKDIRFAGGTQKMFVTPVVRRGSLFCWGCLCVSRVLTTRPCGCRAPLPAVRSTT